MEWLAITILPLAVLAVFSRYLILPRLSEWYTLHHTEAGQKLKAIRASGEEWTELKDHWATVNDDPILKEYYERKATERLKAHKEYDKMLYDLEAPEREARHKERVAQEERERQERIRLYREEADLRVSQNLDSLRQKELNYYNISQSYGGSMLNPTQRLADVDTVLREKPSTQARSLVPIPSNTIINCTGWVNGENYGGTDIWFAVKMGTYPNGKDYYNYVWAGACTEKHIGGLHDFNEYEEDTYTLRSGDGSVVRQIVHKTLIKSADDAVDTLLQLTAPPKVTTLNATLITADKLYLTEKEVAVRASRMIHSS